MQQLADEGVAAYDSENPAASFAGAVWTNNAWIAAQCIAFGILGVWVPYVASACAFAVAAAVLPTLSPKRAQQRTASDQRPSPVGTSGVRLGAG